MIYIDDHIAEFDLEETLKQVSPQRREKALRFRHEAGRRQSVAVYLLLKKALKQEYGITGDLEFGFQEQGKPFLLQYPEIHFSLSHCKVAVACAVSNHPVGIDIEHIRPYRPELGAYVLSEEERQQVEGAERSDVEFIKWWTRKESYLKLTGEGIRNDLKTLDLSKVQQETVVNLEKEYVYTASSYLEDVE